jgi:hypothetical protein
MLIDQLRGDSIFLAMLRATLQQHVLDTKTRIKEYQKDSSAILDELQSLKNTITERLNRLDQTIRDLLQLVSLTKLSCILITHIKQEFAQASIKEAVNMRRVSFVAVRIIASPNFFLKY